MSVQVMAYWVEHETGNFYSIGLGPADRRGNMDYPAIVKLKHARRAIALTIIPIDRLKEAWAQAAIENVRDEGASRRREIAAAS